ncbi:hypothetical protein KEM52_006120 [Ascosphaera acerosa]|nr:hypothetical protein KEM52_006120 [Ascosphaera acerosa]
MIHTIDKPLAFPPQLRMLLDRRSEVSTFRRLLEQTGLLEQIKRQAWGERVTLFAPTDQAFGRMSHAQLRILLGRLGTTQAARLVQGHLMRGAVYSDGSVQAEEGDITRLESGLSMRSCAQHSRVTRTVSIARLTEESGCDAPMIMRVDSRATVTTADLVFDGGVVHLIDTVLQDSADDMWEG